jgi:DNA polymerase III epsilon subunit-like protein
MFFKLITIMKIFVFDTETTGFIIKREPDTTKQPKIIQFAWILWDFKNNEFIEEKRVNLFIDPKIPIPYNASQVNHIYDIDVKGKSYIEDAIDDIMYYINTPDIVIWHNVEYDESVLKIELKRLWMEYKYRPKQVICTMKQTVNFCAIKWEWKRFKYAKLSELHKKLFGEYFTGAHNAITDVEITLKCFIKLVQIWELKVKENKKEEVISLF